MSSIYEQSQKMEDFCSELKRYENLKFLMSDFTYFFYFHKTKYICRSFVKDLKQKMDESMA